MAIAQEDLDRSRGSLKEGKGDPLPSWKRQLLQKKKEAREQDPTKGTNQELSARLLRQRSQVEGAPVSTAGSSALRQPAAAGPAATGATGSSGGGSGAKAAGTEPPGPALLRKTSTAGDASRKISADPAPPDFAKLRLRPAPSPAKP